MEEKKHSLNSTDNLTNEPDPTGAAGTPSGNEENEDVGLTATQLNNIRRSPTEAAKATSTGTRKFLTGTDSDGQL